MMAGTREDTVSTISSDPYLEINPNSSSTADLLGNSGYLNPRELAQRESYCIAVNNVVTNDNAVTLRTHPSVEQSAVENQTVCSEEKADKTDKTFIGKCSFYILVAMVIISSVMSISATVIVIKLLNKCDALEQQLGTAHASYVAAQSDAHMCIPCDDLSQGPFEEDNPLLKELIQREQDGVQTCCAKTQNQISTLLKLFAKHTQLEKCAQELRNGNSSCGDNTPGSGSPSGSGAISAHLIGRQHIPDHPGSGMQPIRSWEADHPTTHTEGLRITDHRIIVPESGLYYIYSQAGFLFYYDEGAIDMDKSQTLYHTVYRYSPIYPNGGNQQLLRSATTQCWEQDKKYGRYTTYVAAAIKLVKGDQLYVKVSHISSLAADMSYFGLFKIR